MIEQYFETIKCEDEELFHLEFHVKRIANTIGMNLNVSEYLYPPSSELLKCKLIYSEEGIHDIQYTPYIKRHIRTFQLVYDDDICYNKKSCNRETLDALFNKRQNSDEIIIVKNGLITDTSIANIAIYDGSSWLTPKKPLLEGTTKNRLVSQGVIFEKDITVSMLQKATKIALLNAMIDMDVLEDYSLFL